MVVWIVLKPLEDGVVTMKFVCWNDLVNEKNFFPPFHINDINSFSPTLLLSSLQSTELASISKAFFARPVLVNLQKFLLTV